MFLSSATSLNSSSAQLSTWKCEDKPRQVALLFEHFILLKNISYWKWEKILSWKCEDKPRQAALLLDDFIGHDREGRVCSGGQHQLETKQEQHKKFRIPKGTMDYPKLHILRNVRFSHLFFCKHMNIINRNVQYQRSSSVGGVRELVKLYKIF